MIDYLDTPSRKDIASVSILIVFSCISLFRNSAYHDSTIWLDVIRKSPNNIRGYQNYGFELAASGKHDEAIATYRKALTMFPDDPELHYNLGRSYIANGRIDDAIHHYHEAIRNYRLALQDARRPHYRLKIPAKMEKAYGDLGSAYYLKGRASLALDHYAAVLEMNPKNALAHYNIGVIYYTGGAMEKARYYLHQAHTLDPDNYAEQIDDHGILVK